MSRLGRIAAELEWQREVAREGPWLIYKVDKVPFKSPQFQEVEGYLERKFTTVGNYAAATNLVPMVARRNIYLIYHNHVFVFYFMEGLGSILTAEDGYLVDEREFPEVYDLMLGALYGGGEVDWRPNETLPEDFYSS